jgi:hypothetical protein
VVQVVVKYKITVVVVVVQVALGRMSLVPHQVAVRVLNLQLP